jgi:hypothetical protein
MEGGHLYLYTGKYVLILYVTPEFTLPNSVFSTNTIALH